MRWAQKRETKRKEDRAYCLLGIFNIFMYLNYGEGDNAFTRLMEEIAKSARSRNNCVSEPTMAATRQRSQGHSVELLNKRKECLRSLSFSSIDDRWNTIAEPHRHTCNWLFTTSQFTQWLSRDDLSRHNGVLWIKGKPGSGKSTLMKHALEHCKRTLNFDVIAPYFFNARGSELEQTPLGMVRSLVYHLVDQLPGALDHFLHLFEDKQKKHGDHWEWHIGELNRFLISEMRELQPKAVLILIDALDECTEKDVRDVVSFIEQLSIAACESRNNLSICLSSRHYPTITVRKCLSLELEGQSGHDQDIEVYIESKLKTADEGIRNDVLKKADHVFLWVVLVVGMLNIAYDEGRERAVRQKLDEVPGDLEQIYHVLLEKDNQHKAETLLLFQWVLYSRALLSPEALYFAVLAGTCPHNLHAFHRTKANLEAVGRYITSTSRGLVEIRRSYRPSVHFIHLSVKEFLVRQKRLVRLDPALEEKMAVQCHDRLAACCAAYLKCLSSFSSPIDLVLPYPFAEYMSEYLLVHAELAQAHGVDQATLLMWLLQSKIGLARLIRAKLGNAITDPYDARLLPYLSFHGFEALVARCLQLGVDVNSEDKIYGSALNAAASAGFLNVVKTLVNHGANLHAGEAMAFIRAVSRSRWEVAKFLVNNGANVNARNDKAIITAVDKGEWDMVLFLVSHGANVSADDDNALVKATLERKVEVVRFLLDKGANANARDGLALREAAKMREWEMAKLLVNHGAIFGTLSSSTLIAALQDDKWEVAKLMAAHRANADVGDPFNLIIASWAGQLEVVKSLLDKGTHVNVGNGMALVAASERGRWEVVKFLIDQGADVHAGEGMALVNAKSAGQWEVAEVLVERGGSTFGVHGASVDLLNAGVQRL